MQINYISKKQDKKLVGDISRKVEFINLLRLLTRQILMTYPDDAAVSPGPIPTGTEGNCTYYIISYHPTVLGLV
jgi:hypothetical protein